MKLDFVIERLAHNGAAIDVLAAGVDDTHARWRPSADEWSILEVINHLVDEEREDFRQRIDFTLHRQGEPWPLTDPPGWVLTRRYNERDLGESRAYLRVEREKSLGWLRGLTAPDWSLGYDHPRAGILTAGDLLASWLVHDLLHIRQLTELHYAYMAVAAPGRRVDYAGDW